MRSNIQIHNMDCMDALRHMEDNQFDLAIVDFALDTVATIC